MTEKIGRGDRQRGIARLTLAFVLATLLLLAVEGVWSPFMDAAAQVQGPTPTGTQSTTGGSTSPSPQATPTGTQIQFLNPSKYSAPEVISNKTDLDTTYHLVAWVSAAPSDATVEFQIQSGSAPPQTIGTATRVAPDTFDLDWDLSLGTGANRQDVADGSYTLRAVLFSAGSASPSPSSPASPSPSPSQATAISTDEEAVTIDRDAETVEILDPPNPGRIGLYDPDFPNNPGAGNNRLPGFTVQVQTSANADEVQLKYSTAEPGAEPSWTTCQEQVTLSYSNRTRRIGCTVPEARTAASLTALSAHVIDQVAQSGTPVGQICTPPLCTPASQAPQSGDAHRLTGNYLAAPASVSIAGEGNATRRTCHQLTATVLDQNGREVWRANVDVHAAGPGDALQFATNQRTSASKPPDGGAHDRLEPLWNCQTNTGHTSETQGVHQRPGASPDGDDRKHIESEPTGGTDPAGEFVFALRSEIFGETQVDVWADEDDDDVNDADTGAASDPQDPQASRTITWVAPSPSSPVSPSEGSSSPSTSSPSTSSPSTSSPSTSKPSTGSPSTSSPSSASPTPSQMLNCDPESDTNPVRSGHTIVCTVSQPGGSPSASGGNVSGVRIHAEATGANDPDGTDSPTSPDFTCVTRDGGSCSFTHGPGGTGNTNDTGTTLYRAWIDSGNNSQPEADTTEGRDEFQQPGQRAENPGDDTDVVEKTWQRAPLDCDPEQDGNPIGSPHTVTCRASTGSGPTPNVSIDVEAVGANDPDSSDSPTTPDFTCTTNQTGECSFTHGPGGTGTTNDTGTTLYRAWIDADSSNAVAEADQTEGRNEGTQPGSVPESDETDVVDKTWTRPPTSIVMDPDVDTASVGTCNPFTITVRGDNNQPVAGVLVDVEQRHERADNQTANDEPRVAFCTPEASDGPNPSAVDQTQGDLDPPDESPDNRGTAGGETLTPTDSQGRVTIGITVEAGNGSDGSGNVVVTAFFETDDDNDPEAGEPQDTSTKTWVVPEGRTIVCVPETATNPVNTQHTVRCSVRDRFGSPVEGEGVTFTEEGPGDFTSRGTQSNANGEIVAVTSSSQGGTQTITATLNDDLQGSEPGEVDECDRPAGTPTGAPAGACSDSVTKTWIPSSSPPTQFERDVTIESQKPVLLFGRNVTLGGTVESDAAAPAACTQFVSVEILRDVVGGAGEFEPFATVQTDEDGAYSYDFRADVSANYVAEVEEVAQCGAATSDAEPVLVKVKVSLKLSDSSVRRGKRVRLTVKTLPCPATAGDRVLLFKAINGEFGKVGSKRTNSGCVKSFRQRVTRDTVFQARWPKQAEELLAGKSRSKIVRIVGR